MPHEDHDPRIDELVGRYEAAGLRIKALLLAAAGVTTAHGTRAIVAEVGLIVAELLAETARWVRDGVPEIYGSGVSDGLEAMGEFGDAKDIREEPVHRTVSQSLAEDLLEDLAKATTYMEQDAKRKLRALARDRLAASMAKRNPIAEVAAFRKEMEERGVRFVDRSGRGWEPHKYARTVLLTHSAIVLNTGALNAAAGRGSPGVRVTDGGPGDVDGPCRIANGQTWSIAYALAHLLEHPNCRRAFAPLPKRWTGTLDRAMPGEEREVSAA